MRYRHHRRDEAGRPPELYLAIVISVVLFGLVVAWLYTLPDPIAGRVVTVDADGNVTD